MRRIKNRNQNVSNLTEKKDREKGTKIELRELRISSIELFFGDSVFVLFISPEGSGPIPEVVQYRANPWPGRSKLLFHGPVAKISLIYKPLNEGRFRY